jgi:hypothetical protein
MSRIHDRLRIIALSAVALGLAVGVGVATGAIPDSGGVIHGCYTKSGGTLRVIDSTVTNCKSTETSLTWNQVGPAGATGAAGTARAYGLVSGTTVTRSTNITAVTNPHAGIFCITLAAGIDPASTGAVVGPDLATDTTGIGPGDNQDQAIAEWDSSAGNCPAGTLEVVTGTRTITTAPDPQGGATFLTTVSNKPLNQSFFVTVP